MWDLVWAALEVQIPLFAVVILGIIAGKSGILNATHEEGLNKFNLYFATPGLVFQSFASRDVKQFDYSIVLAYFLHRIAGLVLSVLLVFPTTRSFEKTIYSFLICTHANNIVIGFPLISQLYGEEKIVFPISTLICDLTFLVPLTLLLLTLFQALQDEEQSKMNVKEEGDSNTKMTSEAAKSTEVEEQNKAKRLSVRSYGSIDLRGSSSIAACHATLDPSSSIFTTADDDQIPLLPANFIYSDASTKQDLVNKTESSTWIDTIRRRIPLIKIVLLRIIKQPVLWAMISGIIYSLTGLSYPSMLRTLTSSLGNTLFGVCLISMGVFISKTHVIGGDWKINLYYFSIRGLISPLIMMSIAYLLGFSALDSQTIVVVSALPSALSLYSFTREFGGNVQLMTTIINITTLFCVPVIIGHVLSDGTYSSLQY
eukprot:TRINITY_DN2543_c0_g1_i2.p1 TRINITY_DN2543_c0_g1~~TRINITY_DN2543_c0_g1_i2.p1  ORF type:complete len:427 (+),score=93.16 TRINITY_DN2543_c0_g1_i2:111-1391(+)